MSQQREALEKAKNFIEWIYDEGYLDIHDLYDDCKQEDGDDCECECARRFNETHAMLSEALRSES